MTQEELFDLVDKCIMVLRAVAVFTVFIGLCVAAGWLVTKMDQNPAKKTVPDCGSCRIYKGEVK